MSTAEILPTAVEPLRRTLTSSGVPVAGATIRCDVSRISAGVFQLLDFNDATFKAPASVGTRYRTLPPVDAVNAPGRYAAATSLDVGAIVGGVVAGDLLTVTYYRVSPDYTLDSDSLRVVAATPTAAAISSQVASDLATAHGAGSWATASVAGLATGQNVLDAVTAIEAYGQIHWVTATGFAVAGDTMTLTVGERTAIASAVWATVISANETLGQAGGALYALKQVALNVLVETDGNPGSVVIMKDDGVTARFTYAIRDKDAGAVTAETGEPARRGAAVAT